jgi:hypothetical protein
LQNAAFAACRIILKTGFSPMEKTKTLGKQAETKIISNPDGTPNQCHSESGGTPGEEPAFSSQHDSRSASVDKIKTRKTKN